MGSGQSNVDSIPFSTPLPLDNITYELKRSQILCLVWTGQLLLCHNRSVIWQIISLNFEYVDHADNIDQVGSVESVGNVAHIELILAPVCAVPVGRRSGGRLAMTLLMWFVPLSAVTIRPGGGG